MWSLVKYFDYFECNLLKEQTVINILAMPLLRYVCVITVYHYTINNDYMA